MKEHKTSVVNLFMTELKLTLLQHAQLGGAGKGGEQSSNSIWARA